MKKKKERSWSMKHEVWSCRTFSKRVREWSKKIREMVKDVMNERERKTRILSMLWGGARWCSILSVRGIGGGAAQRGVACARFLPPVGWWHPYLARAVCSVRFEFTTLLGRKIYGALLKAIQTRTGPFGLSSRSMVRFATRFAWSTLRSSVS